MKVKYIGKSDISFENGTVYEAKPAKDKVLGDYVAIKDESGEWYAYSEKFLKEDFVVVSQ